LDASTVITSNWDAKILFYIHLEMIKTNVTVTSLHRLNQCFVPIYGNVERSGIYETIDGSAVRVTRYWPRGQVMERKMQRQTKRTTDSSASNCD